MYNDRDVARGLLAMHCIVARVREPLSCTSCVAVVATLANGPTETAMFLFLQHTNIANELLVRTL